MNRRAAIVAAFARFGTELADILGFPEDDAKELPSRPRRRGQRPPARPLAEVTPIAAAKADRILRQRGLIRGGG